MAVVKYTVVTIALVALAVVPLAVAKPRAESSLSEEAEEVAEYVEVAVNDVGSSVEAADVNKRNLLHAMNPFRPILTSISRLLVKLVYLSGLADILAFHGAVTMFLVGGNATPSIGELRSLHDAAGVHWGLNQEVGVRMYVALRTLANQFVDLDRLVEGRS